jgi:glycosyltransferase involved in cell wall biosynthesis
VLVVSTLTAAFEDKPLRDSLAAKENLTIIDRYLQHIEEIYQLADAYLFPVEKARNCIDVPLSALEAAACSIPVVATEYGELKGLLGRDGFTRIESFDVQMLNDQLDAAIHKGGDPRPHVLPYDWQHAVKELLG